MEALDAEMRHHRDGRIKRSLGWLSPIEYREKTGFADDASNVGVRAVFNARF